MQQTKILSSGSAITGDKKTLADLQITESSELRVLMFNSVVQRTNLMDQEQIPSSEELLSRVYSIGATETSGGDVNMSSPSDEAVNGGSKPDWSSLTYLQRFISGATSNGDIPAEVLSGSDSMAVDHDAGKSPEVSRAKIIVEQSRYDQLVLKIAELVVSEYSRIEEKPPAKKTAYRILIDAVKTVESIVSIAHDAAAKYIRALEPRAIIVNIFTKFESEQVREQWLSSLESVCKASDAAAEVVFEECTQSIDRIENVSAPCDQYTRVLCALARLEGGNSSSYCQRLAQAVVVKLRRGFSSKFLACNERSGEVLIGLLEFLREVLVVHVDVRSKIARDIVDVVYEECLFTLPSEDRRRCPLHTMRYENGGEASFVLAEGRPGSENGRYVILQPELTGTDATLEVLRQLQRTFCYLRDKLQIRGKESIEESLSAFVEGELMDGDNKVECELCATKKAAAGIEEQEARSNLQQEREETSTDEDMASDDSSDSDEFMADVNGDSPVIQTSSSPSTKLDPNYEYRLKGVLVHSGVAQGGHYYSFIYDHMSEKWFKYDDEDVTPFDPSNIEAECFGGVQRRSWHGSNNSMEMEVFSNALMLFYEKVIPVEPEATSASKSETGPETSTDVVVAAPDEDRCEYEGEVWKSNEAFLQNSYLFDVEFHEFLREMVVPMALSPPPYSKDSASPPAVPVAVAVPTLRADEEIQMTLTEIGVEFVLSVLLHSREKHGIARWITMLASKFTRSKAICARFFSELSTSKRIMWLRGLLFECPDSIARQSFVHLVSRALTAYEAHRKEEQSGLDKECAEAAAVADTTVIRAFLETLASFLDQTSIMQQSHLEECFMLLRNCAEISATARSQLQQLEMIARLINFFLCDRGPSALKDAFPSSTLQPTASRYASPDYQYLLEAVIAILGLPRRTTEPLLTESSTQYPHRTVLSEKAEHALAEIFEDYKTLGGADGNPGLGLDELKKFFSVSLSSATSSPAVEQQARSMLVKYGTPSADTVKDESAATTSHVELDGFMLYYTDLAASSSKSVLQDLRAFGFSEDLQRHSLTCGELPTAAQVLEGLSPLSRGALLNDVFFDSALEEEAETTCELLLRLSLGDRETSTRLLRALLHCLQSTETGWKGQPVVDACALAVQRVLGYECDYQKGLVELALVHTDYGLLSSARSRENLRSRYVNTAHVPLFVYRQLVLVLELRARVPAVSAWLSEHRSEWEWFYEWLRLESLQPSLGGRLAILRREPAKLEMLWRLGEALGIPYQEEQRRYVVEGAGYANVNGVYVSTSHIHDNCLTYACVKSDIEYTLFRCCMPSKARRWYISYSPNKNLLGTMSDEDFYFVQSHIDDEAPPVDGWKVWVKNEKAKPPVPTVRLHSSTVAALDGEGDAADAGFPEHEEGSSAPTAPSSDMVVETVDVDADAETVEYDDSEDEIRDSNERFRAVHLDTQDDGSGTDDFM
uniref:USP domain-containing protein n=1 Tax=Phytophthora ramorum TaxID=164328 RepID=H3HBV0_PHYRM